MQKPSPKLFYDFVWVNSKPFLILDKGSLLTNQTDKRIWNMPQAHNILKVKNFQRIINWVKVKYSCNHQLIYTSWECP